MAGIAGTPAAGIASTVKPPKGGDAKPPKVGLGKEPAAADPADSPIEKTIFLELSRQAELRDLNDLPVGPERRGEAVRRMRQVATEEQGKAVAELKEKLAEMGLKKATVDVAERLWLTNAMVVKVGGFTASDLMAATDGKVEDVPALLTGVPGIEAATDVSQLKFASPVADVIREAADGAPVADAKAGAKATRAQPWNLKMIHVNSAWKQGVDGDGVLVANVDTGVSVTEPTLWSKYRGHDEQAGYSQEKNFYDAYTPAPKLGDKERLPVDHDGHGTHTMGTMVGDDKVLAPIGVAPGSKFIAAAGLGAEGGDSLSLLKAMQFVTAPGDSWGQIDPTAGADVVNQSWGGSGPRLTYNTALRNMAAAGIVNVFAAGNNGRGSKGQNLGDPGMLEGVITVGAVDRHGDVTDFSSKGPSPVTDEFKPFVVAPGHQIMSAVPGGKRQAWSGTSMAAPHVTGAIALLDDALLKRGETMLDLDDAKFVLQRMTTDIGKKGPDDASGYGLIDLRKMDDALDALVAQRAGSASDSA